MGEPKASIHKAFYVLCEDCGYGEIEFFKEDARRQANSHDCVKYLKRKINYALLNGDSEKIARFKIEVNRA